MQSSGEYYHIMDCGNSPTSVMNARDQSGKQGPGFEAWGMGSSLFLIYFLCGKPGRKIGQVFPLRSYDGVGGSCSVIERRIKTDGIRRCRIEYIRERSKATSIQKKT